MVAVFGLVAVQDENFFLLGRVKKVTCAAINLVGLRQLALRVEGFVNELIDGNQTNPILHGRAGMNVLLVV